MRIWLTCTALAAACTNHPGTAAIGQSTPAATPASTTPLASEAYLPDDAVLVTYESDPDELFGSCQFRPPIPTGYIATRRDGHRVHMTVPGTNTKQAMTACILDQFGGRDAVKVSDAGDNTLFMITPTIGLWTVLQPELIGYGFEKLAKSATPMPAERLATIRDLRRDQVGVWTSLPLVKALLGVDALDLTIAIDRWEMPAEWHREMSGTITARFATEADARAAAAKITSGTLATKTTPAIAAGIRSLHVEVAGTSLRATMTKVTIDPRDLGEITKGIVPAEQLPGMTKD